MNRVLWIIVLSVGLSGCGRSVQVTERAFDEGMHANLQVRNALFVQAWGLNRALITESREKHFARAHNAILRGDDPEDVLNRIKKELGRDEAVTSENFAYLAFLMVAGERADSLISQVDYFIASKRPIWQHLSPELRTGVLKIKDELDLWSPLIGSLINQSWLNSLSSAAPSR